MAAQDSQDDVGVWLAALGLVEMLGKLPVHKTGALIGDQATQIRADAACRFNNPTVIHVCGCTSRLFNTIGPRQIGRYGMVVPNLVVQALTGRDITVFGDGAQSRCFTHVNDTVDALVGIAAHPDANGEVYNVGSDHEITI